MAQGLNSSLCNWVLNSLTGRPQVVKIGNITSSTLILINGVAVEMVNNFKFLWVHISEKLKWSDHTDTVVKARQRLFNLRMLKKFGLSPKAQTVFYRSTMERTLSDCITA